MTLIHRALLPGLVIALLVATAGRATDYYTFASARYKITTDIPRPMADEMGRHMDAVNAEYQRIFADIPTRAARDYPLFVFTQQGDYMEFLKKYGVDGSGSGGMFFDRFLGSGLTTYLGERETDRVFHTLRHEGFHQFARSKFGTGLPAWANEGLAEYFGEAIVVGDRLLVGQVPATRLARVKTAIRANETIGFEDMFSMSKTEWNGRLRKGDGRMQYQQSWLIVHFFFCDDSPYRSQFIRYLELIAAGSSSSDAFGKAFGTTDFKRFEQPWKDYVLGLQPNPEKTAAQRLEFLAAGLRYLYTRNKTVDSLDDLKSQLQSVGTKGYWLRFNVGYDQTYEMRASDEENFRAPLPDAPPGQGDSNEASLEFVPSTDQSLPPSIAVKGLSCTLRVQWHRSGDADTLVSRIVYE